jgi:hypothetical protein
MIAILDSYVYHYVTTAKVVTVWEGVQSMTLLTGTKLDCVPQSFPLAILVTIEHIRRLALRSGLTTHANGDRCFRADSWDALGA